MANLHLDDEQLDLYAVGRLPESALASVEEHLLGCEACQGRLARADEFALLFRAAATQPVAVRRPAGWLRWAQRGAMTAAAAAAMVGVIFVAGERGVRQSSPVVVEMRSMRGPEAAARVEAGRPATLLLDVAAPAGTAAYAAQVVDASGVEVTRPRIESKDGRVALQVAKLRHGSYWVRVYGAGGGLIAEYGLDVR